MVANVDIVNRALSAIGTRTNIASLSEISNEAINANQLFFSLRDELLRMAPWNCATNYNLLTLITATPGTPENNATGQIAWSKTLPPPPWAYEYLYPSDCLRDLFIIPQYQTGFASGVPITTAITGGSPSFWNGPPVKHKVSVDQPTAISNVVVSAAGLGYAVGDFISLTGGIGVPGQLQVTSINGTGGVTGANIVMTGSYSTTPANPVAQGTTTGAGSGATFTLLYASAIASITSIAAAGTGYNIGDNILLSGGTGTLGQITVLGVNANGGVTSASIGLAGSYNTVPANPVAQGSTVAANAGTGGTGATFNLAYTNTFDQKVILTNQENAICCYIRRVTDPNQWDSQFQQAMIAALASRLAIALTGSIQIANQQISLANSFIQAARATDGNEGLTVNDVTPDWLRVRGIDYPYDYGWTPNNVLDYGPMFTAY